MSEKIDRRQFLLASSVTAAVPLVFAGSLRAASSRLRVVDLKADSISFPLGLQNLSPGLSWRLESDERGVFQTFYRIRVATSESALHKGHADLWDSGKVLSRKSFDIRYSGKRLASRGRCWWQVEVWDDRNESFCSDISAWEMGLLDPKDWSAQWLAVEDSTARNDRHAGLQWIWGEETRDKTQRGFRFKFSSPAPIKDGYLFVVANGWSLWTQIINVWLDGHQIAGFGTWVGDYNRTGITESSNVRRQLPAISAGDHLVAIRVDTAAFPKTGGDINLDHFDLVHGIAAFMRLHLSNGETVRITSGHGWKTSVVEHDNWSSPDFDDRKWESAKPSPIFNQPWPPMPAMWLRREFAVSKPVVRARLYVTALGAYEARLNGNRVGNALLTPEPSYYAKHVLYRVFDVTSLVSVGENALGVTVGDGWYASFDDRFSFGPPPRRVVAQLEITSEDGTLQVIGTGPEWRITNSAICESQIRIGEVYDARREQAGWDVGGFDDSQWTPAEIAERPSGTLVSQVGPAIQAVQSVIPVSIDEPKPGLYVADFGQNLTGWCRLHVKGARGTRIELAYAELRKAGGGIEQPYTNIGWAKRDVYFLKGDPAGETFEPQFTYRGFRYVQISGLSVPPARNTLTGVYIHTDLRQTGVVRSSSALIQEIWRATARTHDANLIGLPVDTPSREARPYAEVPEIIWDGLSYDRDTMALTRRVMNVFVDNQLPDGIFPRRVLTPLYNNAMEDTVGSTPGHGEAAIVLPWTAWQRFGDTTVIEQYWTAMNRHVDCILEHNPDHIWRTYRGHDEGDWYALDVTDPDPALPHTPKDLVGTAFWAHALDLLSQMAVAIERAADATRLRETYEKVRIAFTQSFVKEDGIVGNGSQTSYVLALAFDLVPAPLRAMAAGNLVGDLRRRGTSLTTGIFGTQFVLEALANTGFGTVAYDLLLRTNYPSWGYMVRQGGGTIWESWSGYVKAKGPYGTALYPMGRSHPDLASVGGFLFRHLAGINAMEPGFTKVAIRPLTDRRLKRGGGDYDSVMGRISTDWAEQGNGHFSLHVTIPANTTAHVYLPASPNSGIREGSRDALSRQTIRLVTRSSHEAVLEIESGSYHFEVHSPAS